MALLPVIIFKNQLMAGGGRKWGGGFTHTLSVKLHNTSSIVTVIQHGTVIVSVVSCSKVVREREREGERRGDRESE